MHWISYAGFKTERCGIFEHLENFSCCVHCTVLNARNNPKQHSILMVTNWHNYLQTVISSNSYCLRAMRRKKIRNLLHASSPFTIEAALYTWNNSLSLLRHLISFVSRYRFQIRSLVFSNSFSIDLLKPNLLCDTIKNQILGNAHTQTLKYKWICLISFNKSNSIVSTSML